MLELISPAGLDELFRRLDSLPDWSEPDVLAGIAAEFECPLDFEATVPVIERHGSRV